MHTTEKRNTKRKSRYSDLILVAADQTQPRQHQKSILSKSDTFKKETVHKHRHRPDHRSWVFTLEKVDTYKAMPSTRPGQTLGFHPASLDYELLLCYRPHKPMSLLQMTNHQAKNSSPP
jgi:hypothetical protein